MSGQQLADRRLAISFGNCCSLLPRRAGSVLHRFDRGEGFEGGILLEIDGRTKCYDQSIQNH